MHVEEHLKASNSDGCIDPDVDVLVRSLPRLNVSGQNDETKAATKSVDMIFDVVIEFIHLIHAAPCTKRMFKQLKLKMFGPT
jgi:hypothetical protein